MKIMPFRRMPYFMSKRRGGLIISEKERKPNSNGLTINPNHNPNSFCFLVAPFRQLVTPRRRIN